MTHIRLLHRIVRTAALLFSAAPACAQLAVPPPPPQRAPVILLDQDELSDLPPHFAPKALAKGPYRVAGRLLDATDGRGLTSGAVTLYDSDSGSRLLDTQAGPRGSFAISDLPAGKYRVEGAARGYITASYDEHEEFSSAIVTGVGLDTESLQLKLRPVARISGRVTDEAGDPVRNATVALFRENTESGSRKITSFRSTRVDDLGRFEFTRLPAGVYYATVRAVPWYATHAPEEGQGGGFGIAARVDPALDVSYPLVFYPEATDASGASPVRLKPGDLFLADFRLTPQPAQRLLIHMPDQQGEQPQRFNFPQLQQKVFDSTEPVAQQGVRVIGSTVEISGLSAGRYRLREASQAGLGPARDVDLSGGSVTLESGSLPSFGSVTIRLSEPAADRPSARKPPQNLQIALRRVDTTDAGGMGLEKFGRMKDGAVELANVEPGDYRIEPANDRFHVTSTTENGKASPGARLHVTGEGQSVTITLGSGSMAITGFARHDGQGESGVLVVLVPAGGDHSVDLYRRDQSDLDGSFRLANVVPGNYLLIAIRDGWGLEWGKPEALEPYLPKAVPVTVPEEGRGLMKLSEDVVVQPR